MSMEEEKTPAADSERISLEEQIRRRAYELYILRGNESGDEIEDWLQAEAELAAAREQSYR